MLQLLLIQVNILLMCPVLNLDIFSHTILLFNYEVAYLHKSV